VGKATYKLAFKGIHYAEVSVSAEMQAANGSISVSATAFAWLKDAYGPDAFEWAICDAYQTAAVDGAKYALNHISGKKSGLNAAVLIDRIHAHPAHTCPDDVSFASCMAVWNALAIKGSVKIDRTNWPMTGEIHE
jgi:hypothetical protein